MVDVQDDRIVRIRPFHYDWKYKRKNIRTWKYQRNGKTLEPNWESLPAPFSLTYKRRVYSPNRVKYPLKSVDWDLKGERNPHNRGKSKFKRISRQEETSIIAHDIRNIHKTYGPAAIPGSIGDTGNEKPSILVMVNLPCTSRIWEVLH